MLSPNTNSAPIQQHSRRTFPTTTEWVEVVWEWVEAVAWAEAGAWDAVWAEVVVEAWVWEVE